jgi:hypothetical protein
MIDSYGQRGISIGSYLSLRMGNLIMGIALHWLEENSFYTDRKGKRKRRFSHVIVYTDNVSIFGSNRTQVKRAMQDITECLCINFKLTVTSPWIFRSLEKDGFYDVAGYKIYASHTTIRKRSFKRTRNECIRNKRDYDPLTARSVASRWGQLKWTDSFNFCTKYKYFRAFSQSKKVIQNEAKSRIL